MPGLFTTQNFQNIKDKVEYSLKEYSTPKSLFCIMHSFSAVRDPISQNAPLHRPQYQVSSSVVLTSHNKFKTESQKLDF